MTKVNGIGGKPKVNQAKAEFMAKEIAKVISPVKIKTDGSAKKKFSATNDILNDSLAKKSDVSQLAERKAAVNTTAKGLLTRVKESLKNR